MFRALLLSSSLILKSCQPADITRKVVSGAVVVHEQSIGLIPETSIGTGASLLQANRVMRRNTCYALTCAAVGLADVTSRLPCSSESSLVVKSFTGELIARHTLLQGLYTLS